MAASGKKVFDEINITPLTDIFLVLLVIMMVVAPLLSFKQLDISISEAAADSEPIEAQENEASVAVSIKGETYQIDGSTVALDELLQLLREKAKLPEAQLIITAEEDSTFNELAVLMDTAQIAGISAVSVAPGAEE